MVTVPKAAEPLVAAFSIAFTRPTFEPVAALFLGAILSLRRRTVTAMLRTLGPLPVGHRSDFHRVRAQAELLTGGFQQAINDAQRAIDGGDPAAINLLTQSAAYAALREMPQASASLQSADATWPPELNGPAQFIATADKGILWIESADHWYAWREQAVRRMAAATERP